MVCFKLAKGGDLSMLLTLTTCLLSHDFDIMKKAKEKKRKKETRERKNKKRAGAADLRFLASLKQTMFSARFARKKSST
ncbi:hypothetical protein HF329_29995 [Chitinophaga oryzae]|uniref:Uncharacterized protein n=1 Tax=Chitinophaga oryzae TaxID=2725414 RepID=A0AAE6ZNL6_9BACT|nr:hypothetical protein [Chitinophaga oryzae]QJB35308.1 hypothetical protein HF329_29995 [Chitinophaga oryzae]